MRGGKRLTRRCNDDSGEVPAEELDALSPNEGLPQAIGLFIPWQVEIFG